jgi:hypothetical protein
MQIISLFPTAVGMFHLGRDLTESEKGALLDLEMKPNMGNTTSADRFILRKEELKDLLFKLPLIPIFKKLLRLRKM